MEIKLCQRVLRMIEIFSACWNSGLQLLLKEILPLILFIDMMHLLHLFLDLCSVCVLM